MYKWKKYASVAAIALASITSSAWAKTELKFAHAAPTTDLQQNLAEYFAKEVAARTDGEVTVKIFPHGQLGKDGQMIDGVRSGIIDIQMTGLNNLTGLVPEAGALMLPYIFTDRQHAFKVLDGEVGDEIGKQFEAYNMKMLGYPENGYRNITNNRNPIRTPEDVVGLKIRTNNSVVLNELFSVLKANPQPMPVAELYTALETKVVDAQEHPIGITLSFKYYEVQKYLSLTEHSYSMLNMTMNLKKFNKLSEAHQQVILDVAQEAVDLQRNLSIEKENAFLDELASHGMEINKDVDKEAFQQAAAPVWDKFIADHGDALVKKIQAVK